MRAMTGEDEAELVLKFFRDRIIDDFSYQYMLIMGG